MKYNATVYQAVIDNQTFWIAESQSLQGCVGQGKSPNEAIKELEINELEWLNAARMFNIPIPSENHYVISPKSWDNIETVEPDKTDLRMLREIESNPNCHEFVSSSEAMQELGL